MNDDVALNLYRIVQEAVNNAIRHGRAQQISISFLIEKGKLWLSIADNGSGFIHNHASHDIKNIITPGIGIKIMRYRTKQIGATLEFLERPEGGVEVKVSRKLS
jgi:signal transduction histidine kinase